MPIFHNSITLMMPGPFLQNCYPASSSLCSVCESDCSAVNETLFASSLNSLIKKKERKQKKNPDCFNFSRSHWILSLVLQCLQSLQAYFIASTNLVSAPFHPHHQWKYWKVQEQHYNRLGAVSKQAASQWFFPDQPLLWLAAC